jgi:hypothetical protein
MTFRSKNGGSFDIQKFLSKLPGRPFAKYPGEWHIPGHNYAGPGTRLDIRLDVNDKPKPGEEPIDRDDEIAYLHDLAYRDADNGSAQENLKRKQEADRIMLQQLDAITDPTIRERLDRLIIKAAIGTKLKLGVGLSEESNREKLANELHYSTKRMNHPCYYTTV